MVNSWTLVIEAQGAGFTDCNSNGVDDDCDVSSGTTPDCNGNGTLDNCDLGSGTGDCDGNLAPDSCDIAAGAPDCDGDGTNDCSVMEVGAVRAAISYSFDYETHRRDTYDNSLAPQYGPIPAGFLYADTKYETFTYDLVYAEQLLEDAGFSRQYGCSALSRSGAPDVVPAGDRDGTECRLPNILGVMANEGNDYRIAMAGHIDEVLATIGVTTSGTAVP